MDQHLQSATSTHFTHFAMTPPPDASVDSQENRIIFHNQHVQMDVAALSREFSDVMFHIGGLDDPRIIVPLGSDVTVNFQNQDTANPHGWRLIADKPPFQNPQSAAHKPLAFVGSEVGVTNPQESGQAHFTANQAGIYTYICPVSEDGGIGLYGIFEVSPSH
ncbi:MAG: hypothetical protein OWR62_01055 [Sulfobacillus thermotolerans]|uniref:Blue (type 1) copper domain-containing protein n=1 Tax=Sulfobacillus thermotolerans TaxID=338644 RepID=A0ABN5GYF7_9FIRM|nr:hypothetical protein BXT84_05090 [Sulfobacillus thermotolerans]MCY0906958.1 hypothetical protein [Sulfobacillus thermotolerans]